jgi:hypothetical protein
VSEKWGQRLGNIIAIVALVTAIGAVYALRFRHEPTQPGRAAHAIGSPPDSAPK